MSLSIPRNLSLPDYILEAAFRIIDPQTKLALIHGLSGASSTFQQLRDDVLDAAWALTKVDPYASSSSFAKYELIQDANVTASSGIISPGDVMLTILPNHADFIVMYYAATALGAVVSTCNPLSTQEEITKQMCDCEPKLILTSYDLFEKVLASMEEYQEEQMKDAKFCQGKEKLFRALLIVDHPKDGIDLNLSSLFSTMPLIRVPDLLRQGRQSRQNDQATSSSITPLGQISQLFQFDDVNRLAALPYSSGTTGISKGVMLSHFNLISNVVQLKNLKNISASDRVLAVLPFFHIFGLSVIINHTLSEGGTLVHLPKFDLLAVVECIEKYEITMAFLVPPIILAFVKHPAVASEKLKSLELIISGAAPLGADLIRVFEEKFPHCRLEQGYGLTETAPVLTLTECRRKGRDGQPINEDDQASRVLGSVGKFIPDTEYKLIDDHGVTLQSSTGDCGPGELCVKGPQVMLGYLNKKSNFSSGHTFDDEGFYHTGDLVKIDQNGNVFVIDRLKELIKYKGVHIAPAELEAVILKHPAVSDVAVIPSPDPEVGEIPKAFVVRKDDSVTEKNIMDFVSQHVNPQKKVRVVEFIDAVPKSVSGKILRRILVLRERESKS